MHPFELWVLRRYLAAALKTRVDAKGIGDAGRLANWLSTRRDAGLRFDGGAEPQSFGVGREYRSNLRRRDARFRLWRQNLLEAAAVPPPAPSPLQARLDWLAEACGLDARQREVFDFFARIARSPHVRTLVAAINNNGPLCDVFDCREASGFVNPTAARREVAETGFLVRLGLLEATSRDNYRVTDLVETLLGKRRLAASQLCDLLLGKRAAAALTWEDFAHLDASRDLAARLVESGWGAATSHAPNLLIYGAPGTGKSEFVKTLGARLGCPVYFIGEDNGKGTEPKRQERIAALAIANAVGAATEKMIVVVDEADDLFAGVDEDNAATRQGSKVFMHRLIEKARAPTVWIVNDVGRLGPAVVRRMNLVMRFSRPGLTVRRKIVERIARRENLKLDGRAVQRLASLPAAPALIENAIRSAARIQGAGDEAAQILGGGLKAMGFSEVATAPAPLGFDAALSRADVDLVALAARVKAAPSRALSFCLSGPPGTGKSAFARHLAEEMGLEVLEKRYSDLASAFVGESEKAIAAAFEEAADLGAFLILDEADSLLRDRSASRHSWEITQVNEMLTWMERHPWPVACTTNAPDLLDPATSRRFLFKVRFLPMDAKQIDAAFSRAFHLKAPSFVLKLDVLTPGDFAVVARKAEALGEYDPARLARWLADEVEAKPEGKTWRMGFYF